MGVGHQEHDNQSESDHKHSKDNFTPLLGSAEPSSLLEWGCGCAVVQQSCLQSGKILWWSWKKDKAKLHVKVVAAECFIYVIFPTTFCNAEK